MRLCKCYNTNIELVAPCVHRAIARIPSIRRSYCTISFPSAGNIFLDASYNIKIGDFGLAKELTSGSKFAYTSLGTPFYMWVAALIVINH